MSTIKEEVLQKAQKILDFYKSILLIKKPTQEDKDEFLLNFNKLIPSSDAFYECYIYYSLLPTCTYLKNEDEPLLRSLEDKIFQSIEVYEGGEGEGEKYYEVYHIKPLDMYIRRDGTYYSYSGVESLSKFYEVTKKTRLVDFYE